MVGEEPTHEHEAIWDESRQCTRSCSAPGDEKTRNEHQVEAQDRGGEQEKPLVQSHCVNLEGTAPGMATSPEPFARRPVRAVVGLLVALLIDVLLALM